VRPAKAPGRERRRVARRGGATGRAIRPPVTGRPRGTRRTPRLYWRREDMRTGYANLPLHGGLASCRTPML
jgi:hypothetical protein